MKKVKITAIRGLRKTAHLTRRSLSVGANISGRIENKAHRIINGTDNKINIYDTVLYEKYYYGAAPNILPIHPALPVVGRKNNITLFIPSLQKSSFFGGTATALLFTGFLAQKMKLPIKIVETLAKGKLDTEDLSKFYLEHNLDIKKDNLELVDISARKYNNYGYIEMDPKDIFIVSAWWDAYTVSRLPLKNKFIYLIQDFEPIFYNNSDSYVLAESTYLTENFIPVCNTKLMHIFMANKGYEYIANNSLVFEPAINIGKKNGYSVKKNKGQKNRMFLYGRPSVHRNLFLTGLTAINKVFNDYSLSLDEWELFMAGQDGIPDIELESGLLIKNLGKMDIADYYNFAKTIDVAVSLMMAPHPSYPPLEFASMGAAVVTSKYQTKKDLKDYSKNIITTNINVDDIANAIVKASKISLETRIRNAKESSLSADWAIALNGVVEKVSKKLNKR